MILSLVLVTLSCHGVQIIYDVDKTADFGQFHTYNFKIPRDNPEAPIAFNEINQNFLKGAISNEMVQKNYKISDDPNLMISFYLKVEDRMEIYDYGPYYGYDRGWTDHKTYYYKIGTLTIDLVDTNRNRLVWQGSAIGVLPKTNKNAEEKINLVVNRIFSKYPYLAGESKPVAKEKRK